MHYIRIGLNVFLTATGLPPRPTFGDFLMQKLIDIWAKNPTLANAIKIRNHANKRPMSILTLSASDIVICGDAILTIQES